MDHLPFLMTSVDSLVSLPHCRRGLATVSLCEVVPRSYRCIRVLQRKLYGMRDRTISNKRDTAWVNDERPSAVTGPEYLRRVFTRGKDLADRVDHSRSSVCLESAKTSERRDLWWSVV
jgi:hypothetical protein